MRVYMDLDSQHRVCPCGSASESGEGWIAWNREHAPHTNGQQLEIVTDDGARCLSEKPEPALSPVWVPK